MKHTDEIKQKTDNTRSEERSKTIPGNIKIGSEEAGVLLSDNDLDMASGGGKAQSKRRGL